MSFEDLAAEELNARFERLEKAHDELVAKHAETQAELDQLRGQLLQALARIAKLERRHEP